MTAPTDGTTSATKKRKNASSLFAKRKYFVSKDDTLCAAPKKRLDHIRMTLDIFSDFDQDQSFFTQMYCADKHWWAFTGKSWMISLHPVCSDKKLFWRIHCFLIDYPSKLGLQTIADSGLKINNLTHCPSNRLGEIHMWMPCCALKRSVLFENVSGI